MRLITRQQHRRIVRCAVLLPLLLGAAACSVSQDEEVQIGRQNSAQINGQLPLVRDAAITDYVQHLGVALARTTERADLDWRFFVVDSRQVNAFALPGGFIYVNRGLIERSERLDELAGALAHEIAHVVRRHSVEQMNKATGANAAVSLTCMLTSLCESNVARAAIQVGGAALFARYSRGDEAEADEEAVRIVPRAGIHPDGIPTLFERLLEERRAHPAAIEAFFASHPLEEDRIQATRDLVARLDPASLTGLQRDQPSYQAFRARLRSLPAPPRAAEAPSLPPTR